MLKEIRELAKSKGMPVMFRKGRANEFTIFIYDKRVQPNYLIGFDGHRASNEHNLTRCCEDAKKYILNYEYSN